MRLFGIFLTYLLILGSVGFSKCFIEDDILDAIMHTEAHTDREAGYEFLISFNSKSDAEFVREFLPEFFIDNRTIDCRSYEQCVVLAAEIWKSGIMNLDLGAYQINPLFHHMAIGDYFKLSRSRDKACEYISNLVKQYGYGWFAIASYHSQTASLNYKYQKKLIRNWLKITQKD